jgi:hypothetical protein
MTESTPVPAEQVVAQAATTALADDQVAPETFIPAATRDNYAQIARDQATARGVEPRAVMRELADQWQALHERQPLDGYDHLAAWGRDFDPAAGSAPSGLAVLQARTLESARRDPYQAVIGDQALVEQAVAAQVAMDQGTIGVTSAPSVTDAGMLTNAGPLPVPTDVTPSTDPAVAEQQQAAAEQRDPGEQLPSSDATATASTSSDSTSSDSTSTDSPSSSDTASKDTSSSKSSKSSGSSS